MPTGRLLRAISRPQRLQQGRLVHRVDLTEHVFLVLATFTIRIRAGSKLRASAKASAGVPDSHVSNSASSLKSTGMRS